MAKIMVSLPDDLVSRLDDRARVQRTTRSGLLRELAERALHDDAQARARAIDVALSRAAGHGGNSAGLVREQRRAR
jgi:metal-responsive CopG/Arc/MetJ family transcriptional regulator